MTKHPLTELLAWLVDQGQHERRQQRAARAQWIKNAHQQQAEECETHAATLREFMDREKEKTNATA